jgi:hypothetical protein
MFGLLLALAPPTVHADPPPAVALDDCHRFGAVHDVANLHWRQARVQREKLAATIWMNNDPDTYEAWLDESAWRVRAWDLLDNALNESWSADRRVLELIKLHRHIGRDDYAAGRMPWPSCNCR